MILFWISTPLIFFIFFTDLFLLILSTPISSIASCRAQSRESKTVAFFLIFYLWHFLSTTQHFHSVFCTDCLRGPKWHLWNQLDYFGSSGNLKHIFWMSDAIIRLFILFTPNLLNITAIDACVFQIEEFLLDYVFICKDTTLNFIGVA